MPFLRQYQVINVAGTVPRAVDQRFRRDGSLLTIWRERCDPIPIPAAVQRLDIRHASQKGTVTALVLQVPMQSNHQGVTVHDPRGFALNYARLSPHLGFPPLGLVPPDQPSRDTNSLRVFVDTQGRLPLLVGLGHDPFLRVDMGHIAFAAEVVHQLSPLDAEFGFKRVGTVVKTSVDDLYNPPHEQVF